jgi:peptidoglycan/LPS O-acetylase OafA/YrhL
VEDPRKLDSIDAVRGLAVLGVVLLHCTQLIGPAGPFLSGLTGAGVRGVQLFYVASAFTLCRSWQFRSGREASPLRNFFLRRFFRIAPVFYVAIAAYLLLYGLSPREWAPWSVRWWHVVLTALFLHGVHPDTINSVVPGGWSVTVEMTFYLCLPFVLRGVRGVRSAVAFGVVSIALAETSRQAILRLLLPLYPPDLQYVVRGFAFFNFFSQLPVFAAGILAYFASQDLSRKRQATAAGVTVAAFAVASVFFPSPSIVWRNYMVIGVLFAIFVVLLGAVPTRVLVNRPIILLGRWSFSLYLAHFGVVEGFRRAGVIDAFRRASGGWLLFFAAVLAVTSLLSFLTYTVVEQPGIRLGKRWIAALEGRDAAVSGGLR